MKTWPTLDVQPDDFRRYLDGVARIVCEELADPARRLPFPPHLTRDEARGRLLPLAGKYSFDDLVSWVRTCLIPYQENLGHPGYFGWVFSPGNPISALAEFLVAGLNLVNNSSSADPILTEVELACIEWIGQSAGFGPTGGTFVSGGTVANLTALAVAREHATEYRGRVDGLRARGRQFVGYISEEGHFSIDRAFELLGIGSAFLRRIPVDSRFRMRTEVLSQAIARDKENGYEPFCVIGTAGSTNTGAIDPIQELVGIAKSGGLWLHVDGAYGAFGASSALVGAAFAGLDQCDSLTVDPHKWLSIPVEAGCVLVRDVEMLHRTFRVSPHYLATGSDDLNLYEHGIQLTRADRSLKIYLALLYYGVDTLRQIMDREIILARELFRMLRESTEFQCLMEPALSIVVFRYIPSKCWKSFSAHSESFSRADETFIDQVNRELELRTHASDVVLVSSTELRGRFWLRACLLNYRASAESVEAAFDALRYYGRSVVSKGA